MHSSDLMISISGVRGIVGQSLTPELLVRLGHAFGSYTRAGRVVLGRDTRNSGEMARHAVLSGLLASGCQVIDVGVCATPTATLMVEQCRADGGIMITASHNPIEWNALKFFRPDGMYLNADEGRDLLNLYYSGQFLTARWDELKAVEHVDDATAVHVQKILALLKVELIRSKRFRVALDCVNGAGSMGGQLLLQELGCSVETVHCTPDGRFPRRPEPVTANLNDLCDLVKRTGADAGFATDPDADRMSVVDEDGRSLGEEASLALCTRYVLSRSGRNHGAVVVNLSTSRVTEEVVLTEGFQLVRVPAGEVNVAEKMKELNAIFGGEGNGGIIDPRLHYGRDGILGIALALEAMAHSGKALSRLAAALPAYHMLKTKLDCPPALSRRIIRALQHSVPAADVDTRDGLRLSWDDRWVQLRASNTEPIIRVIAEGRSEAQAHALVSEFSARIEALMNSEAQPRRRSMRKSVSLPAPVSVA